MQAAAFPAVRLDLRHTVVTGKKRVRTWRMRASKCSIGSTLRFTTRPGRSHIGRMRRWPLAAADPERNRTWPPPIARMRPGQRSCDEHRGVEPRCAVVIAP